MELPPAQPLFTIAEAAALLKTPKRTLYRRVREGRIPGDQIVDDLGVRRLRRSYLCGLLGVDEPATGDLPAAALARAAAS